MVLRESGRNFGFSQDFFVEVKNRRFFFDYALRRKVLKARAEKF
jgi:hypothetical protein